MKKSKVNRSVRGFLVLLFVVGAAALPMQVEAAAMSQSCADIKSANPSAQDGLYAIVPNAKLFVVYCHDMAGTPSEYLPLVLTGGLFNFSNWAGEHTNPQPLTTHYTRVRLDPATLLVDIGDQTFSSSTPGPVNGPGVPIFSMPYGVAGDCLAQFSDAGKANIDLTGTPFIVDDTFVVRGFLAKGSVNGIQGFEHSPLLPGEPSQINVLAQVVNLKGGGFCGGVHPGPASQFAPINDGGGFDLQLKYIGPVASGPDACKKGGWQNFGIFKNQGDCVSFFATGGNNQPALINP